MDEGLIVYGADWCGDCRRAKRFLTQHSVPFRWIDIEKDKDGEKYVREVNKGLRSIPTIIFQDGSILVEPSNFQLAKKLNISLF